MGVASPPVAPLANLGTAGADPAPSCFGDSAGMAAVAFRELRGERKLSDEAVARRR